MLLLTKKLSSFLFFAASVALVYFSFSPNVSTSNPIRHWSAQLQRRFGIPNRQLVQRDAADVDFPEQVTVSRGTGNTGNTYTSGSTTYRSSGLEDNAYMIIKNGKYIVYDDSALDETDKQLVSRAASSWNTAFGKSVVITLSEAQKLADNPNLKATVLMQYADSLDNTIKGIDKSAKQKIVGEASTKYVGGPVYINILKDKNVTGDRIIVFEHEIGHALGLGHIDLDDPMSHDIMSYGQVQRYITKKDVTLAKLIYVGIN